MRIYATRRECEIILNCLYNQMSKLDIDDITEYNAIANRIIRVTTHQCERDHSKYTKRGD